MTRRRTLKDITIVEDLLDQVVVEVVVVVVGEAAGVVKPGNQSLGPQ